MIINNSGDLVNALKFLVPNCKCAVWDHGYDGENEPIILFNMKVDWHSDSSCPTENEISNIDINNVNLMLESERKKSRDSNAKNDLGILAAYSIQKKSSPDLTLSQYLDDLEKISASL